MLPLLERALKVRIIFFFKQMALTTESGENFLRAPKRDK